MKQLLLLAGLVLALGSSVRAQAPVSVGTTPGRRAAYATEHDSLLQRAARVRARTEARIVQFSTAFGAVGGTRRKIVSYGRLKIRDGIPKSASVTKVKTQINKHKTHGAEISKVFYYGIGNRLLLAEYYEQRQLVRLDLYEYPLRDGNEYGTVFRHTEWASGDYLRLTTHAQENRGTTQRYYYTAPRQPE
jgi:hypothetical protein